MEQTAVPEERAELDSDGCVWIKQSVGAENGDGVRSRTKPQGKVVRVSATGRAIGRAISGGRVAPDICMAGQIAGVPTPRGKESGGLHPRLS